MGQDHAHSDTLYNVKFKTVKRKRKNIYNPEEEARYVRISRENNILISMSSLRLYNIFCFQIGKGSFWRFKWYHKKFTKRRIYARARRR